jgi:hemolysin activation/secretion protein
VPGVTSVSIATLSVATALLASGQADARSPAPSPGPAIGSGCDSPDSHCFQLNAVSIEGATAYRPGALAPTYQAYLTREVGTADLVAIAAAITDKYRADGYFLSRAVVPSQLRGGHVAIIRVYEGYIGSIKVTGDGAPMVERLGASIQGKRPLRLADLEHYLRLAADSPGLGIKSRLEPLADDPAKHRLVLSTTQKAVEVSAYIDNRGPKGAGPWQASMRAALNSVAVAGDQLAVTLLAVPDHIREFAYAELSYSLPVASGRLRGSLGVSRSSEGGTPISRLIGGESWEATLSYLNPVKLTRALGVWVQVIANARHIEHHWTQATGYTDDVQVLRGLITATEAAGGHSTNVSGGVSAGQRSDVAPEGFHGLSRSDASRDFWKVNAHVSHYQDLGAHAGLYVAADGQWSPNRLMTSEQFAAGGAPYGRGYNYAGILGDRGVAGTVELRAGFDPKTAGIKFVQGYTFIDAGKVWNSAPNSPGTALASAGVGVRLRIGDKATLGVEAARRLTRTPDDPNRGWRPSVYLSAEF